MRRGYSAMLSFGSVLSCRAPLRMYFFGTAKGHNGPRAISKIMKWMPIVVCSWVCDDCGKEGVFTQFWWSKCLLSSGDVVGESKIRTLRVYSPRPPLHTNTPPPILPHCTSETVTFHCARVRPKECHALRPRRSVRGSCSPHLMDDGFILILVVLSSRQKGQALK